MWDSRSGKWDMRWGIGERAQRRAQRAEGGCALQVSCFGFRFRHPVFVLPFLAVVGIWDMG